MARCSSAKICGCASLAGKSAIAVNVEEAGFEYHPVRNRIVDSASYVPSPTRSAKEVQSTKSKLPGTGTLVGHQPYFRLALPSAKLSAGSAQAKKVIVHFYPFSNVPRSKNRNKAYTQSAFWHLSTLWEKVPGHQSFSTALSATNRHRSAASLPLTTLLRSPVRLHSFLFAFPTPRIEGLAPGR